MKSEIRSAKSWANYLSQNPNYKIESLIADAQRNALEFATAICREQLEPRLEKMKIIPTATPIAVFQIARKPFVKPFKQSNEHMQHMPMVGSGTHDFAR